MESAKYTEVSRKTPVLATKAVWCALSIIRWLRLGAT